MLNEKEKQLVNIPLENYLKGHATGDPEYMRRAFYTQGNMIFMRDGKYTVKSFDEFIAGFKGTPAPDEQERTRRIESLDITGNTAIAKIVLNYPHGRFTDYMTLLKVEGEWKIVNKSFYLEPKSGTE